jgi:hypothetical protein
VVVVVVVADQHFLWPPLKFRDDQSFPGMAYDIFNESITEGLEDGAWTLAYIERLKPEYGGTKSAIWIQRYQSTLNPNGNGITSTIHIVGNPVGFNLNLEPWLSFRPDSALIIDNLHQISECGGYFMEIIKWVGDNRPNGDGETRLLAPEDTILDPADIYTVPIITTTSQLDSITDGLI